MDFIKQQQELAKKEYWHTQLAPSAYIPELVAQIIQNTGEELMRLVGNIDTYTGDDLADTCTKDIQTQAKKHIANVTGVDPPTTNN